MAIPIVLTLHGNTKGFITWLFRSHHNHLIAWVNLTKSIFSAWNSFLHNWPWECGDPISPSIALWHKKCHCLNAQVPVSQWENHLSLLNHWGAPTTIAWLLRLVQQKRIFAWNSFLHNQPWQCSNLICSCVALWCNKVPSLDCSVNTILPCKGGKGWEGVWDMQTGQFSPEWIQSCVDCTGTELWSKQWVFLHGLAVCPSVCKSTMVLQHLVPWFSHLGHYWSSLDRLQQPKPPVVQNLHVLHIHSLTPAKVTAYLQCMSTQPTQTRWKGLVLAGPHSVLLTTCPSAKSNGFWNKQYQFNCWKLSDVKRAMNNTMDHVGCPARAWLLCAIFALMLFCHLPNSNGEHGAGSGYLQVYAFSLLARSG